MHNRSDWSDLVPRGVDLIRPHPTRMYDYYLGGCYNFAVDRRKAVEVLRVLPEVGTTAIQNRAYLRRIVRYCVQQGVHQLLDLGSGLLSAGTVHEFARLVAPDCRVLYVDNEPVTVARNKVCLTGDPYAACIEADITKPEHVLGHPETQRLLDLARPMAVLMLDVLPFLSDADHPGIVVGTYRKALAHGSFLALSHITTAGPADQLVRVVELYRGTQRPMRLRAQDEIAELLSGFGTLVWPGLVPLLSTAGEN